jgi:hypothetical protein
VVKTLPPTTPLAPRIHSPAVADDPERLREQLREHGQRRRAARETDREELRAIAELLPQAVDAGISKREIERLTGVSRPWIDQLLRGNGD